MARQARLDVPLSSEQRREIDAMASATGMTATALGRLGIVQLRGRLIDRLHVLHELVHHEGKVSIPRKLLTNRTTGASHEPGDMGSDAL
jgi:hypothetical protein